MEIKKILPCITVGGAFSRIEGWIPFVCVCVCVWHLWAGPAAKVGGAVNGDFGSVQQFGPIANLQGRIRHSVYFPLQHVI